MVASRERWSILTQQTFQAAQHGCLVQVQNSGVERVEGRFRRAVLRESLQRSQLPTQELSTHTSGKVPIVDPSLKGFARPTGSQGSQAEPNYPPLACGLSCSGKSRREFQRAHFDNTSLGAAIDTRKKPARIPAGRIGFGIPTASPTQPPSSPAEGLGSRPGTAGTDFQAGTYGPRASGGGAKGVSEALRADGSYAQVTI